MKIITDPRCTEYAAPGHPERPERISRSVARLRDQKKLPITWLEPAAPTQTDLLRAHSDIHLRNLEQSHDFDADTPAHPQIAQHARRAVGSGLRALAEVKSGGHAFSLMRPPGHHATREQAMGFCYLSSAAIVALAASAAGARKVAVYDFDVHHGNGTEDILLDQPGLAFFSVHQHPAYPGTGLQNRGNNCFNFPVRPGLPRTEYRAVLESAWQEVKKFQPDLLVISAGFDAYHLDPLAQGTLQTEDFHWLGELIKSAEIPTVHILEGGYSEDLPELILTYLTALDT